MNQCPDKTEPPPALRADPPEVWVKLNLTLPGFRKLTPLSFGEGTGVR